MEITSPDNGPQLNNNILNSDGMKEEYENNHENSVSKTNGDNYVQQHGARLIFVLI